MYCTKRAVQIYAMNFFIIAMLFSTGSCTFFKKLSYKGLPKLPELNALAGEKRNAYYHEDTVSIMDFDIKDQVIRCELVEVYDRPERDRLLHNITSMLHVPYYEIGFQDMLAVMKICDILDNDPNFDENPPFLKIFLTVAKNAKSYLYGISPGTNWCGTGDIANNYHHLGEFRNLDRCCRAHDLCPVKVLANDIRYGIDNKKSDVSKSHCLCDETFYNCLKNIHHPGADIIGIKFFNLLKPQCIEEKLSSQNEIIRNLVPTKKQY